jgi:Transcriptional regulator, AbiEi antitoxin
MTTATLQRSVWRLAREQHGVVSREQLLLAGLTPAAIRHRVLRGRLIRSGEGYTRSGVPTYRHLVAGWPLFLAAETGRF